MHAKQARGKNAPPEPEITPPATMARGGIAEAARTMARQGRGNDTMIAHITPREANMLRAHGGMGTTNPATGMLEFDFWDDLRKPFKAVGDAAGDIIRGAADLVGDIVSSPIGKVLGTVALATFLGPGAFGIEGLGLASSIAAPLASAGITLLGGGNLQDALISGATAYFGAPGGVVSNFVQGIGGGMVGGAVNAALSSGLVGVGAGMLQGKSLADSVKNGLIAGAIGGGMAALPSMGGESPALGEGMPKPEGSPLAGGAESQNIAQTGVVKPETDVNSLMVGQGQGTPAPLGVEPPSQLAALPGDQTAALQPSGIRPQDAGPSNVAPPASPTAEGAAKTGIFDTAKDTASGAWDKAKGLYDEYLSPSSIKKAGMGEAEKAGAEAMARLPANAPDALKTAAYQKAYDAAMPGMLQTYGPLAAAGIAGLALTGGFDVKEPQLTPEQLAMRDDLARQRAELAANPGKWYVKNLRGVTYDAQGRTTGSTPYDPSVGLPSSLVAPTQRQSYLPSLQQPYNTAGLSSDLSQYLYKPPAKKALGGGIGSLATGGYPRKTGAIDGPGTATSDSIPAMLSDGEFVMTAKAVRGAGKGSRLAGAKKMYALMHQLERNASRS